MTENMRDGVYEPDSYSLMEQLPPQVRRALCEADYSWCVAPFLHEFEQTGSLAKTIAAIRIADMDEHKITAKREKRTVIDGRGRFIRA